MKAIYPDPYGEWLQDVCSHIPEWMRTALFGLMVLMAIVFVSGSYMLMAKVALAIGGKDYGILLALIGSVPIMFELMIVRWLVLGIDEVYLS